MRSVVKPLSIITTIVFVAGIIVTAIYLYQLPTKLIENSTVLDLNSIEEIKPALQQSNIIVAIVLALGLAAIVMQVMALTSQQDNVVYVEKFKSDNAPSLQNQGNSTEEQLNTSSLSQEILQEIQQAAADTKEPEKSLEYALRAVCKHLEASQGAVYVTKEDKKRRFIELRASFAYMKPDSQTVRYEFGEGLSGQVAKEGAPAYIDAVPDGYIKILSGLGQATPKHLFLLPVKENEKVIGVVEIASFTAFTAQHQEIARQAFSLLGKQFSRSSEKINVSEEAFEEVEDNSQNL